MRDRCSYFLPEVGGTFVHGKKTTFSGDYRGAGWNAARGSGVKQTRSTFQHVGSHPVELDSHRGPRGIGSPLPPPPRGASDAAGETRRSGGS